MITLQLTIACGVSKLLNTEEKSDSNILSLLERMDSDADVFIRLFEEE